MLDSIQPASTFTAILIRMSCGFGDFGTAVYVFNGHEAQTASISDATTQMDHNAVVLVTIDRLAHSPRTTVRTRGTGKAPDR